jgi:hypothetical protein
MGGVIAVPIGLLILLGPDMTFAFAFTPSRMRSSQPPVLESKWRVGWFTPPCNPVLVARRKCYRPKFTPFIISTNGFIRNVINVSSMTTCKAISQEGSIAWTFWMRMKIGRFLQNACSDPLMGWMKQAIPPPSRVLKNYGMWRCCEFSTGSRRDRNAISAAISPCERYAEPAENPRNHLGVNHFGRLQRCLGSQSPLKGFSCLGALNSAKMITRATHQSFSTPC